ncbi:MAG: 4-hydroxythreonine-4-phosphate dehydrogenase PdxA [Planctomycetota bacterium]
MSIKTALLPRVSSASKPLIGITMGDPHGIGAEVIVKALQDPAVRDLGRFVVFGLESAMERAADRAGIKPFWFHVNRGEPLRVDSGTVVVNYPEFSSLVGDHPRPTLEGGKASLRFYDDAIDAARSKITDGIVTGPIHKVSWRLAGCPHPDHTERIAAAFNNNRVTMMFIGAGLRVALASIHVGIFDLRNRFTIGMVFQPIDLLNECLKTWFEIERPRIAVAGLNPHAGEEGQFGDEERRIIEPAIQLAKNVGIEVEGPFPADTLFVAERRQAFDGIVAMYHDQGLIPIKMLAFDSAVNLTLGLPVIRTSVDHGTGFDIVGTNQANPGSMKHAIRLACKFACAAKATVWPQSKPVAAASL